MAKLSASDRQALSKNAFVVPSKAPGSGSYPIEDKSHAQNALARSSGKPVAGQVRAAVERKYPGMGSGSANAPKSTLRSKSQPSPITSRVDKSYSMGAGGVDRPMTGPSGGLSGGVDRPVGQAQRTSPGRDMAGGGHMGDWADKAHPVK